MSHELQTVIGQIFAIMCIAGFFIVLLRSQGFGVVAGSRLA